MKAKLSNYSFRKVCEFCSSPTMYLWSNIPTLQWSIRNNEWKSI